MTQKHCLNFRSKIATSALALVAVLLFPIGINAASTQSEDCGSQSLTEKISGDSPDNTGNCRSYPDNFLLVEATQFNSESPQEDTQDLNESYLDRNNSQSCLILVKSEVPLLSKNTYPTSCCCTSLSCRAPPQ